MKSASIVSLLFAAAATAAPFDLDKRAVTTEVQWETVVVYTTVFEDELPAATPSAGAFYEKPQDAKPPPKAKPTPGTQGTPAKPAAPVVPITPPSAPSPVATSKPVVTPTPEAPAPPAVPKETPVASPPPYAPAPSSPAPPAAPQPTPPAGGSGTKFTNVDVTIYEDKGHGACGPYIGNPGDMYAALAKPTWGESTTDRMTGESTNPWCGQKIRVYGGIKPIVVTIMDLCPGCPGADIDLTEAAWVEFGQSLDDKTRLHGISWEKID